jgi:hypothetical protein
VPHGALTCAVILEILSALGVFVLPEPLGRLFVERHSLWHVAIKPASFHLTALC